MSTANSQAFEDSDHVAILRAAEITLLISHNRFAVKGAANGECLACCLRGNSLAMFSVIGVRRLNNAEITNSRYTLQRFAILYVLVVGLHIVAVHDHALLSGERHIMCSCPVGDDIYFMLYFLPARDSNIGADLEVVWLILMLSANTAN